MISKKHIELAVKEGRVEVHKHPEHDLFIYNYTQKTQFEKLWDPLTLACRGLILNKNYQIMARPFAKFFNKEELASEEIPKLNYEVYEKMDGSLGILYWSEGIPRIATRKSFTSKQAIKATQLLHTKYKNSINHLNSSYTYLFEIIYPENRIVVDYGLNEDLVLLGIIDIATGKEYPLKELGFPIVKKYDEFTNLNQIYKEQDKNREGFVIKFSNNFRMKVKFSEYIRLHKLVTQLSTISIWEHLKNNRPLEELLCNVPDEFFQWVKNIREDLISQYQKMEDQCKSEFKILDTRKETADYFLTSHYASILFAMLDHKDYSQLIWKKIRPEYEKPFQ
ncbi:T4 RnlA family RNA ligase [Apibacter raozihei]|uniref:T4 RnlA family RNA ligase n=1 Tax=Apibacter raozihei TaxID=2500547 RepID=UPI000FE37811|nr:T4 RnlA family RNA ligase [Apibacter raozihei]